VIGDKFTILFAVNAQQGFSGAAEVGTTGLRDYRTTRPLIFELTTDFTDGTDGSNRRKEMEERRWEREREKLAGLACLPLAT